MSRAWNRRAWLAVLLASAGAPVLAQMAPWASPAHERWKAELAAFAASDQRRMPPAGGILFVGSSTIRMWQGLEQAFPEQGPVIRRGVGGSRLQEWVEFVPDLVLPYRPRQIVLYAGENDLVEGFGPMDLLGAFVAFVRRVRLQLPEVPIAYVSIKPSPSRMARLEAMREANLLIQTFVLGEPNLDYIELHAAMLDNDGQPRPELYQRDKLHLTREGYALWRQVISAHLRR